MLNLKDPIRVAHRVHGCETGTRRVLQRLPEDGRVTPALLSYLRARFYLWNGVHALDGETLGTLRRYLTEIRKYAWEGSMDLADDQRWVYRTLNYQWPQLTRAQKRMICDIINDQEDPE